MNAVSQSLAGSRTGLTSRFIPLGLAAMLGIFVVGFSGFAHIDAVHNAGHDYRHSMGFPCH